GLARLRRVGARLAVVPGEHQRRKIEVAREPREIARGRFGHPARLAEIAGAQRVFGVHQALARPVVAVLLEAREARPLDALERAAHRPRALRQPARRALVGRSYGLERPLGRAAPPLDRAPRELRLLGLEAAERVHRL